MTRTLKLALVALTAAPLAVSAQEAAAPEEEHGPKVTFSGMVDAYYTLNLDHPQTFASPTSGAGNYSSEPGFNLSFAKITAEAEAGAAAFRLDLGFAKEGAAIGSAVPSQGVLFPTFVQQAYGSYKLGGVTLEAGRFVTPAGFEVYEAKDNWLYSKGLLFNFAVPTAHEGARVSVPFGDLTATAYLANGSDLWTNDIGFTRSPYKTGILNLVYAKEETSIAVTGLLSKVPGTLGTLAAGSDVFQIDAVVTQGFGALSVNVSGDWVDLDGSSLFAAAASAKYDLFPAIAVVGRIEYLDDEDGIRTGAADTTLTSYTAGLNCAIGPNAALKAEVRLDHASENFYGVDPAAPDSKDMATFTLGAIAWF